MKAKAFYGRINSRHENVRRGERSRDYSLFRPVVAPTASLFSLVLERTGRELPQLPVASSLSPLHRNGKLSRLILRLCRIPRWPAAGSLLVFSQHCFFNNLMALTRYIMSASIPSPPTERGSPPSLCSFFLSFSFFSFLPLFPFFFRAFVSFIRDFFRWNDKNIRPFSFLLLARGMQNFCLNKKKKKKRKGWKECVHVDVGLVDERPRETRGKESGFPRTPNKNLLRFQPSCLSVFSFGAISRWRRNDRLTLRSLRSHLKARKFTVLPCFRRVETRGTESRWISFL